jgi:hypothetical protein
MLMMNINFKFDKELGKKIWKKTRQYSTLVVVEGVKSVALQGVTKVVNTAFTEGPSAVKNLKFEGDIVKINNEDKPKRKLFSKKNKKAEDLLEAVETQTVDTDTIEEIVEEVETEVIDKKK